LEEPLAGRRPASGRDKKKRTIALGKQFVFCMLVIGECLFEPAEYSSTGSGCRAAKNSLRFISRFACRINGAQQPFADAISLQNFCGGRIQERPSAFFFFSFLFCSSQAFDEAKNRRAWWQGREEVFFPPAIAFEFLVRKSSFPAHGPGILLRGRA